MERNVRPSDKKEVLDDLKGMYTQGTETDALKALDGFIAKHGRKYPSLHKVFEGKRLFSFYGYPESIRRSIYTSNLIENNNKQLKHLTKKKEQFPNEDSLSRFACSFYSEYNRSGAARGTRGSKKRRLSLQLCLTDVMRHPEILVLPHKKIWSLCKIVGKLYTKLLTQSLLVQEKNQKLPFLP